jgi:hypothetical protein
MVSNNTILLVAVGVAGFLWWRKAYRDAYYSNKYMSKSKPWGGVSGDPRAGRGQVDLYTNLYGGTVGGLQHPTKQPATTLNGTAAMMSFKAAKGDPTALKWMRDHNMRNYYHVGGPGTTGAQGV